MLKYFANMKVNLSSLKNIISDVKEKTKDNRISNITLINSRVLLLSFSTYRKEKLLINLEHQSPFISFCNVEESIPTITGGLSDILRKELKEAIVYDIKLINDDRAVDFSFIKTNDYFEREEKHLTLELIPFRPNLILTDKDGVIFYAAHYSSLENNHPILKGMKYVPINKNEAFKEEEEITPLEEIKKYSNELIYKAKRDRLLERYEPLFKYIKVRIKSLKQKLKILDKEKEEAQNKLIYREIGENLLAFINEKELLDSYLKDNNIEIDYSIPVGQTANSYFKKYKKAKRTIEMNQIEKDKATKEMQYLEVTFSQIDYMNDEDLYELAKELMPHKFNNIKNKPTISKYSYVIVDDTKIYFGKNQKQNNDITFKLANKDDYFFHIKDYHGSHVVIMNNNPSKEMILTASEMCLILSNKEVGEIQYTQIKNIKKGQELGLALLNNYELIVLNKIRQSTYDLLKKHH